MPVLAVAYNDVPGHLREVRKLVVTVVKRLLEEELGCRLVYVYDDGCVYRCGEITSEDMYKICNVLSLLPHVEVRASSGTLASPSRIVVSSGGIPVLTILLLSR